VAISVAWQTVATVTTAPTGFYTVPSASTVPYGAYARDLVITNSGAGTIYVCLAAASTVATSVGGFQLPVGGTVLLTQCQVPASSIIGAAAASTAVTNQVSLGWATNVAYI
jgi:hypothetical protein